MASAYAASYSPPMNSAYVWPIAMRICSLELDEHRTLQLTMSMECCGILRQSQALLLEAHACLLKLY